MALVRHTVSNALTATGNVTGETLTVVRDVARGAVSAAEEVGTGLLRPPRVRPKGLLWGSAMSGVMCSR
ncbi:hypothetical protein [Nitrosococcus wardiae]|uniref:Uncharacterized protein n=1 Tax=Nitrosococcus wardiae TaxID=1814290 RepID=A0A4P7C502_9GAMM|nr:hypothetical protein [Nitrosococcus wardiae]QBQ55902.1 hypothetical protein E3U44_16315 [Nitrosococcus wardiae]